MKYTKTEEARELSARMPPGISLILGPIVGFVYVVFLPFIGVVMAVVLTLRKMGTWLFNLIRTVAIFGWRPLESYLIGRKKHIKK